MGVGRV